MAKKFDFLSPGIEIREIDQSFILHGDELSRFQTKWLQKVRRYEELKELEHQEQLEKEEEAQ